MAAAPGAYLHVRVSGASLERVGLASPRGIAAGGEEEEEEESKGLGSPREFLSPRASKVRSKLLLLLQALFLYLLPLLLISVGIALRTCEIQNKILPSP